MSHLHAQAAPGDVLERRETVAVDIARVASTCAQHFYSADADPRLMQVCWVATAVWYAGYPATWLQECRYRLPHAVLRCNTLESVVACTMRQHDARSCGVLESVATC